MYFSVSDILVYFPKRIKPFALRCIGFDEGFSTVEEGLAQQCVKLSKTLTQWGKPA